MIARTLSSIRRRLQVPFVFLVCLFPLLALTHSASAIPLTAWNFAANAGNEPSVNATFVAPGFQTTAITRGGTQAPQIFPGSFSNGSWPGGATPDGYFEFSINPSSSTTYTISDIIFELVTQELGPNTWLLRSDADGFVSNLDNWTAFPALVGPALSTHTTILPATPDYQNLMSARTFRLYGVNSSGGGAGLTHLQINGSVPVASVPETLPFGAFGLAVTLLLFARSRIKD